MIQLLKKIEQFIQQFLSTIRAFIGCMAHYIFDCLKKHRNKLLYNNRKDIVIVMGNGPSLNEVDFEKLKDMNIKVCCVNYFPLKKEKDFFAFKPAFLCLIDPGFFDYIIDAEVEDFRGFIEVLKKVDWKLRIIAPVGKRLKIDNPNITYEWLSLYTASINSSEKIRLFFYNRNMANTGMQNVVIGALFYFLTCQYKKVYLAGVDMSDFKNLYVDENNRVYVDSNHSYGNTRYYFDEMPEEAQLIDFADILSAYQVMFVQFRNTKRYADLLGIEVVNLSTGSYIDVFNKMNPDLFFNGGEN